MAAYDIDRLFSGCKLTDLPKSKSEAIHAGLKHFFTGIECKKGHISARHTRDGCCCQCAYEHSMKWVSENREAHYASCKQYRDGNSEKRNAHGRDVWAARRGEMLAKKRARYAVNKEKIAEQNKKWDLANPEKRRCIVRNRRAKRKMVGGTHTNEDIKKLRHQQKDMCGYCKVALRGKGHVDHIVAIANGGENGPRNLQLLCRKCNQSKSDRDPIEYARSIGLLL